MTPQLLRFFLDHCITQDVQALLSRAGYQCWTAEQAQASRDRDDELTVYAMDKKAVLVTWDVEFSKRRRRNTIGRHVQLVCPAPEMAALVARYLPEILAHVSRSEHVFVRVSKGKIEAFHNWE